MGGMMGGGMGGMGMFSVPPEAVEHSERPEWKLINGNFR